MRLPSKLARPVDKAKRGFDGPAIPAGTLCESAPPGRVVDAELEYAGLFYAYNADGEMPGTIVFVPFAELFR